MKMKMKMKMTMKMMMMMMMMKMKMKMNMMMMMMMMMMVMVMMKMMTMNTCNMIKQNNTKKQQTQATTGTAAFRPGAGFSLWSLSREASSRPTFKLTPPTP